MEVGVSQLIDIFVDPAKAWAQQKERPTFLVPALVVAFASAIAALAYFMHVDPEWFAEYQLQAMAAEMSASEVAQAKSMMPGARAQGWIAAISTPVVTAIVFAIMGLYYLLAGKVAGHAVDYRRGLSLATWSSMPMLIIAIISLVATYTSSPQSTYESMQLLSIDPLFVQLPRDHAWSTLAKTFSLLNLWAWFLAALGWKTWFRTGWGQALFVAMLPGVVVFGVMAAFALT